MNNTYIEQISSKTKKDSNKIFAWLMAIIFFVPNINYYISFFLSSSQKNTTTVPFYVFTYLIVIFAYLKCTIKKPIPIICFLSLMVLYLITYYIWPQNYEYMFGNMWDAVYNPFYRIVFLGMPLFFLPLYIENPQNLYNVFCKFAVINLIIALFSFFYIIIGKEENFEYMTFAYNTLFAACLCFTDARKRKSKPLTILSVLSLSVIIIMGSRGAMLSVLVFAVLYTYIVIKKKPSFKQMLFLIILGISVLVVIILFENVLIKLDDILQNLGFESRSIKKLLENSLFEDSERNSIYRSVAKSILNSPLVGNGLFGDRYVTSTTIYKAVYAHNIFLEFLCHFGIIIGGFISLFYLYITIRPLFAKINPILKEFYICVFSATFFRMMVSASYITEPLFYFLIGITFFIKKQKNMLSTITPSII